MTPSAMTISQTAEITGLYRYPIKGLTPEALPRVSLRAGQTLPADRPLRHRERPERLRSGSTAVEAEDPVPDAGAE
ncbi:hypothetical protein ACVWXL_006666 [Bradyrhizobium sp. GM22.5]